MSLVNSVSTVKQFELGNKYYLGTVIDNNDPLKIGRVRARVDELHGDISDIPDEHLPWCMQVRKTGQGSKLDHSSFYVPVVGSQLMINFHGGDLYSPMYEASLSHLNSKVTEQEIDYPNSYGFKDSNGNLIHVNLQQETLYVLYNGNVHMTVNPGNSTEGNLLVDLNSDCTVNVKRDCTVNVERDCTTNVKRDCTVNVKRDCKADITRDLLVDVGRNARVSATSVLVEGDVELGSGGSPIARVGDGVQVAITSGSSAGVYSGTITSGGTNKSV